MLLFHLLQEVKECAISCMGLVISTFGDYLRTELPACLPVLVDRMGNEITRLTAVKVSFPALLSLYLVLYLSFLVEVLHLLRHFLCLAMIVFG